MTSISSIALMGLFVWSGAGSVGTTTWTPQTPALAATSTPETVISVRLTGYNAVPEQTDSDPTVTASGVRSNPDVIAARSRDLADILPFGTVIALETAEKSNSCGFDVVNHLIGYRVIADSMHPRKQNQVDIMFDMADKVKIGVNGQARKATNPAVALGVCSNVSIRVVGKLALKEIPATQGELAVLMNPALATR
jgi:3D (Asp-Asp-Asp) domain-containing protein